MPPYSKEQTMRPVKSHRSHVNKGRGSNKWLSDKLERKLKRERKMVELDKKKMEKAKRRENANG